mmetsp:Transcript_11976/g.18377  ORF Transcript_11976/g.18377 Transcript_11976/m.18377 type:complete len:99 (+) Transcript_11976:413-709(+)
MSPIGVSKGPILKDSALCSSQECIFRLFRNFINRLWKLFVVEIVLNLESESWESMLNDLRLFHLRPCREIFRKRFLIVRESMNTWKLQCYLCSVYVKE